MAHPESRYSTLTRTTANTVGFMLLQSRIRSSSNPDIPAPQSPEDAEVNYILGKVQIHKCNIILVLDRIYELEFKLAKECWNRMIGRGIYWITIQWNFISFIKYLRIILYYINILKLVFHFVRKNDEDVEDLDEDYLLLQRNSDKV